MYSDCCGSVMTEQDVTKEKCPICGQYCDIVYPTTCILTTNDPKPAQEEEHPELNVSEG